MTQNRMSRLERGETDMTPGELSAFCRYFGVTAEYFLFDPKEGSRPGTDRVKEDKADYSRLVEKLSDLKKEDFDLVESLVDQLIKR